MRRTIGTTIESGSSAHQLDQNISSSVYECIGAMMSGLVMYMKMMKDEIIQSVDRLHESVGTIELWLEKNTAPVLQGSGHAGN